MSKADTPMPSITAYCRLSLATDHSGTLVYQNSSGSISPDPEEPKWRIKPYHFINISEMTGEQLYKYHRQAEKSLEKNHERTLDAADKMRDLENRIASQQNLLLKIRRELEREEAENKKMLDEYNQQQDYYDKSFRNTRIFQTKLIQLRKELDKRSLTKPHKERGTLIGNTIHSLEQL